MAIATATASTTKTVMEANFQIGPGTTVQNLGTVNLYIWWTQDGSGDYWTIPPYGAIEFEPWDFSDDNKRKINTHRIFHQAASGTCALQVSFQPKGR